jgi:uncharacterized cupin superfamily protein
MIQRVKLDELELHWSDDDPEGFRSGGLHIGRQIGSKMTGTSLYELPPGQSLCPYHYEYGEEEWLLVLDGEATVRTPDETSTVAQREVVFFPTGPAGAHEIRNDTDSTVRVLMWSNVLYPTATAYPDSDKVGVYTGDKAEDGLYVRSTKVDYFHGEERP